VGILSAAFSRLLDAMIIAAALVLLAMVIIVTGDILLRNTVGWGFVWANEVSEYALYVMTLLAAPWLLRQGRHVRLDLVLAIVPPRVAWRIELLADMLGLLACLVLLRYGALMAFESFRLHSITIKILVFPEWWLLAPLPLVFLLLAIEFLFRLHRLFTGDRGRRREATSVG
jgi:TRAP-type C4-dicarboxylate transport system permease small subunit